MLFVAGRFSVRPDSQLPFVACAAGLVILLGTFAGTALDELPGSSRAFASMVMGSAAPGFVAVASLGLLSRIHRPFAAQQETPLFDAVVGVLTFVSCAFVGIAAWHFVATRLHTIGRHMATVFLAALCTTLLVAALATQRSFRHPSPSVFAATIVKDCSGSNRPLPAPFRSRGAICGVPCDGECIYEGLEGVWFRRNAGGCSNFHDWNLETFASLHAHLSPSFEVDAVAWAGLAIAMAAALWRLRARRAPLMQLGWTEVWRDGQCQLVEPHALESADYRRAPEHVDARYTMRGTRDALRERIGREDAAAWLYGIAVVAVTSAPLFAAASLGLVFG